MIILKTLRWSNVFSYGRDNVIHFNEFPIIQLVGKNGHGKSSIPLILEEVLYNKNSKGIKKADILNRNTKDKSYTIELDFDKDGVSYTIQTTRGTTQTVILLRDGDNISAHTATGTFKLIEDVIGFDHKTFSQLIYQSSSASLEFLTATDTNRKKFLIDLLNLTRYSEAFEVFKKLGKEAEKEVAVVETKLSTTQSWLSKAIKEDLSIKERKGYPVIEESVRKELFELEDTLSTVESKNRKINTNNAKRSQLNAIDDRDLIIVIPEVIDTSSMSRELGEHRKTIKDSELFIKRIEGLQGQCPTCYQSVDRNTIIQLIKEQNKLKSIAQEAITKLDAAIKGCETSNKEANRVKKVRADWEVLYNSIDKSLPNESIDAVALQKRIEELRKNILATDTQAKEVEQYNAKVDAHNSRVSVISGQITEMRADLETLSVELERLNDNLALISILQKTFSTNGLIAYKIECLVKDLEDLANMYLADLSGGRFQLTFKISTGDKLNVIITDSGRDIDILALSSGERSRVNVATLLAIRKLMQSLSNSRVNLLILDETIENLDIDGKEKLVEVLLKEEHLNTFLISHGFTHPLLEKIMVVKEKNMSRLE